MFRIRKLNYLVMAANIYPFPDNFNFNSMHCQWEAAHPKICTFWKNLIPHQSIHIINELFILTRRSVNYLIKFKQPQVHLVNINRTVTATRVEKK